MGFVGRGWVAGLAVEEGHGVGFGLVGYFDVGAHGGVVGVAGPFHDDLWGDAEHEGLTDEGAAAAVGGQQFVFGEGAVDALGAVVLGDADGGVDAGYAAELFEEVVQAVVGDSRQGVGGVGVAVFFEDCSGVVVEVDEYVC